MRDSKSYVVRKRRRNGRRRKGRKRRVEKMKDGKDKGTCSKYGKQRR